MQTRKKNVIKKTMALLLTLALLLPMFAPLNTAAFFEAFRFPGGPTLGAPIIIPNEPGTARFHVELNLEGDTFNQTPQTYTQNDVHQAHVDAIFARIVTALAAIQVYTDNDDSGIAQNQSEAMATINAVIEAEINPSGTTYVWSTTPGAHVSATASPDGTQTFTFTLTSVVGVSGSATPRTSSNIVTPLLWTGSDVPMGTVNPAFTFVPPPPLALDASNWIVSNDADGGTANIGDTVFGRVVEDSANLRTIRPNGTIVNNWGTTANDALNTLTAPDVFTLDEIFWVNDTTIWMYFTGSIPITKPANGYEYFAWFYIIPQEDALTSGVPSAPLRVYIGSKGDPIVDVGDADNSFTWNVIVPGHVAQADTPFGQQIPFGVLGQQRLYIDITRNDLASNDDWEGFAATVTNLDNWEIREAPFTGQTSATVPGTIAPSTGNTPGHSTLTLANIGLELVGVIVNPHGLPTAKNQDASQIRLVLEGDNVRGGPFTTNAFAANTVFIRLNLSQIPNQDGTPVHANFIVPILMPNTDMTLEIVPASLALGWTGPGPRSMTNFNTMVAGDRGGIDADRVITVRAELTNPNARFVANPAAEIVRDGQEFFDATDVENWRVHIGEINGNVPDGVRKLAHNQTAHGLELVEVNLMAGNPRVAFLTLVTDPSQNAGAHLITTETNEHSAHANQGGNGGNNSDNLQWRVYVRALEGIVAVPSTEPILKETTTWHTNRAAQVGVTRDPLRSSFLNVIGIEGEVEADKYMTATGSIVTANSPGGWNQAFVSNVPPSHEHYVPFSFPEGNFRPEDIRFVYVTLIEETFVTGSGAAAAVADLANWRLVRANATYTAGNITLPSGDFNTQLNLTYHPNGGHYGITLAAVELMDTNRARLIFIQTGDETPRAINDYDSLPFFIDVHPNALAGSGRLRAEVRIDPFTPPMTPFIHNTNKTNDITIPNNTVPAQGATYITFTMDSLLDTFRTELNYLVPGLQIVPDAALSILNWEWTADWELCALGNIIPVSGSWTAVDAFGHTVKRGLSFESATVAANNTVNVTLIGTPSSSGPIFIRATSSVIAGIPHGLRGLTHSFRHTAPAAIWIEGEPEGSAVSLVVTSLTYTNPFGHNVNDAMTGESSKLAPHDDSALLPNRVILNPGRPLSPTGVRHITVELQGGATFNSNVAETTSPGVFTHWTFETYYQYAATAFAGQTTLIEDIERDLSERLDPALVYGLELSQVIPVPGHANRAILVVVGDAELLANAIIAITVDTAAISYGSDLTALLRVGEDLRPRMRATTQTLTGAALSDNIPDNADLNIRVWIENDWITRLAQVPTNWQVLTMTPAQKAVFTNTNQTTLSGGLHPGRSANHHITPTGSPGMTAGVGTSLGAATLPAANMGVGQLLLARDAVGVEEVFSYVDMRIPHGTTGFTSGNYVAIFPAINAPSGENISTNSLIASYLNFDRTDDFTPLPVLPLFIPIGPRTGQGGGGGGGGAAQTRANQGRTAIFQAVAPPVPVDQDDINTEAEALAHVVALVGAVTLPVGMTKTINPVGFVAAANGVNGSFVFNVRVNDGEAFAITTNISLVILADPDEKTCECGKHPEGSKDCDYYVADTDCPNCNDMSCYECLWILHLFVEASARGMTIPEFIEYFVNFITGFYAFVMEWSDHIYEAEGVRLDFYETLYWLESVGII